jgi:hypothetical protein
MMTAKQQTMEDQSLRTSASFARFFTSHKLRGGYKLKGDTLPPESIHGNQECED